MSSGCLWVTFIAVVSTIALSVLLVGGFFFFKHITKEQP